MGDTNEGEETEVETRLGEGEGVFWAKEGSLRFGGIFF